MIEIGVTLVLLILGYGFGRYAEAKHYRSIIAREKELAHIPAVASKFPDPSLLARNPGSRLVSGSVVISVDYFKRFVAGLRNIFGGRVSSYESLLDRARREALLRMKQEASEHGAEIIFNVKLETASISKGQRGTIGSVEMLAYGTALLASGKPTAVGL